MRQVYSCFFRGGFVIGPPKTVNKFGFCKLKRSFNDFFQLLLSLIKKILLLFSKFIFAVYLWPFHLDSLKNICNAQNSNKTATHFSLAEIKNII